jgi:hypothetical protein
MMLPLMLYAIVIASAFGMLGIALEQILARLGRPRRWAWAVVLGGSLLIPPAVLPRRRTDRARGNRSTSEPQP